MIFELHGVFFVYLVAALAWNVWASAPTEEGRSWERYALLPLQLALTAVLIRDRLEPNLPSWLNQPAVAALFPLAFLAGLAQNVDTLRRRGARLTDIPIVLFNVFVGLCVTLSGVALITGRGDGVLLYDYSLLQWFVGTWQAHVLTLSWHLPMLLRRRPPESIVALLPTLLASVTAAFCVLVLIVFHGPSGDMLGSFALEPEAPSLRADLQTGVWRRADFDTHVDADMDVPGRMAAWVLPADHDGTGLVRPARPLALSLRAPDAWSWERPSDLALAQAAFLDGAETLARALQPELLLPFPEPDGEAVLAFGHSLPPDEWARLFGEARDRVLAVSPGTALGLRLAGSGERTHELFVALAEVVDVAGPRLNPGGLDRTSPDGPSADRLLAVWRTWHDEQPDPPALWILAAGCSPLAYGEWAQARFLQGCLARAAADSRIQGVLLEGWRDLGHTLGVVRADGSPRTAAVMLDRLLPQP